jgi:hypothetical protein
MVGMAVGMAVWWVCGEDVVGMVVWRDEVVIVCAGDVMRTCDGVVQKKTEKMPHTGLDFLFSQLGE